MAAPNLSALSNHFDVGVQLRGIDRPTGRPEPREDTEGRRKLHLPGHMHTPGGHYVSLAGKTRLEAIAEKIKVGSGDRLASRWIEAVQVSMEHKERVYKESGRELDAEIRDQQQKLNEFVRQARLPVGEDTPDPGTTAQRGGSEPAETEALAPWAQTDKWDLVKDRSDQWSSLIAQKAAFREIGETARARKDFAVAATTGSSLRRSFREAILELATYENQSLLLESMADLIEAFINAPLVTQNAFVNFVFAGDPGVGKTRLAHSLGKLLSRLGMYVYESVVECGRSDFVAEFVGQTAPKTKAFLLSNLEKVIFLDEAYSLTAWSESANGVGGRTLESYSAEAMAEVVAFLSQFVGRSCIIAAGYERQMMEDFLPANEGLTRRFAYIVVMQAYSAEFMVNIFIDALAKALSTSADVKTTTAVRRYFTIPAIKFLEDVLVDSKHDSSEFPLLHKLFAPQAGAMVNLANVAAVLISSSRQGSALIGAGGMGQRPTWAIGFLGIHDIIVTQLQHRFPERLQSDVATGWVAATDELRKVGARNGWIKGESWVTSQAAKEQVAAFDQDSASTQSSNTSERSDMSDPVAPPPRRATRRQQ